MNDFVKTWGKRLLRRLVAEYRINWIYATDKPPDSDSDGNRLRIECERSAHRAALRDSPTSKMRSSQSYADAGLSGLVLLDENRPLSVAHFAERSQYNRSATWPLKKGEIALMDIATEEDFRGHGLATLLINAATRLYLARAHKRLIAFIWWSNFPSQRAFEKAGWRRIGFSVELRIGHRWLVFRIPLPKAVRRPGSNTIKE